MDLRLSCLSLLLGTAVLCVAAAAQEPKRPDAPTAPEIRTLAEWAPAFSAPRGPKVRIAPELAEQRLGVFGKQRDAKTLREAAARLLEYEWKARDADHPDQLVLTASRSRQLLPEKRRTEMALEGREALRRRMVAMRDVLTGKTKPEQFAEQYPEDAQNLGLPVSRTSISDTAPRALLGIRPTRQRLEIIKLLTDADIDRLLRDGVWVSGKPEKDTPLGDYVRAEFPRKGATIRSSTGELLQPPKDYYDEPRVDYRLIYWLYGSPDLLGIHENAWNMETGKRPAGPPHPPIGPRGDPGAIIGSMRMTGRAYIVLPPPAPPLHKDKMPASAALEQAVQIDPGFPDSALLTFQQALALAARAGNLSIVSDFYAENNLRRFQSPRLNGPVKAADLLDRIAGAFQYTWEINEGVVLFRHARWPFAEQGEIPGQLTKALETLAARGNGLSLAEQTSLAARLTRPQFENIPAYVPRFHSIQYLHNSLYLFQSLTNEQRELAISDEGLPFLKMSPSQQAAFGEVTQNGWPLLTLSSPAQRAGWRLHLAPAAAPSEGWHFIYECGEETRLPVFLPAVREMPPLADRTLPAPYPEYHPVY